MNMLELLHDWGVRFSEMPTWGLLLGKASAVLAIAWLVHFILMRLNPRWRVFLWRGTVVGIVLLGVWTAGLPGFVIRLPSVPPAPAITTPSPGPIEARRHAEIADVGPSSSPKMIRGPGERQLAPIDREAAENIGYMPMEPMQTPPNRPIPWESWLLAVWGLGASMLCLWLASGYIRLVQGLKHAQPASEPIIVLASQIRVALGCPEVRILVSRRFTVPFVCGVWRPVIVLPEALCDAAFCPQLPGVLAHELAHVRSHDVAWTMVLQLFSVAFWFHPMAWRVGTAHRTACDAVCDAVSASYLGDVQSYRRTLAKVALCAAVPVASAGLAMARSCDVRRRLAALERKVFSASLKRRTVAFISLVGLSALGLLAGLRLALAEPKAKTGEDQSAASVAKEETVKALRAQTASLILRKGVAVEGTVTRPDGKPAAGAAVGLFLEFLGGSDFPRTKTDNNGHYRIMANEPGEYTVAAAADGFVPGWKRTIVGKDSQTADLRLGKGERIRLRVVDQAGKPMPGIYISTIFSFTKSQDALMLDYESSRENKPAYHSPTDADGRWSRLWIPEDKITFYIQKAGYATAQVSFAPDEREQLITLQAGVWSVSGRVIDQETKAAIRQFRVTQGNEYIAENMPIWYESRPVSNEKGEYRLTWDQPDENRVICIEADGYYPSPGLRLGSKQGQVTCNFELKKGENITGIVRSPRGKLLADVDVVLCTPSRGFSFRNGRVGTDQFPLVVRTGADGRFTFSPQNDPYLLVAAHDRGFAQVDDVAAMKEITLQPWARVEGTVTIDGKPGVSEKVRIDYEPLWGRPLATLSPQEQAAMRIFRYFEAKTDAAGHFVLDRVQPGKATICRAVVFQEGGGLISQVSVGTRSIDLSSGDTLTVNLRSSLTSAEIRAQKEAGKNPQPTKTRALPNDPERGNRIKAALKVLQAKPPIGEEARVEAALEVFRNVGNGNITSDIKPWATAVRELIEIGKPAVPKLIAELDQTESHFSLQALGFVLRGIGDPRAVPALIRAIPRLFGSGSNDFGVLVQGDPELTKFMKQRDSFQALLIQGDPELTQYVVQHHTETIKSQLFDWCRPLKEIMVALQSITGESQGWREINFADFEGYGTQQVRIKRTLFLNHATKWADWWSRNWRRFVSSEADAQLDQTRKSLALCAAAIAKMPRQKPPTEIPCGPKASIGNGFARGPMQSFNEYPWQTLFDLDSGRIPIAPKELVQQSPGGEPSQELVDWAQREGVNLICVKITPPGSDKPYYALKPLNMKVWRIDNDRYNNLRNELCYAKKVELPQPWQGNLAQTDEKTGRYEDHLTASFLFISQNGICGMLQIGPAATRHGGWSYQFIYEKDAEKL